MRVRTLIAVIICLMMIGALNTGAGAHSPNGEEPPDPNAPTAPPADPVEGAPIPSPDESEDNVNEVDPFGTNRRQGLAASLPEGLASCSLHARDVLGGGNFRTDLGLAPTVDRSSATEIRYGIRVTPIEAEFLDGNMRVRASVDTMEIDETLKRDHAAEYVDSVWNPASGMMEVYVRRSGAEGASRSAVEATLSRATGAEATVVLEIDSPDRTRLDAAKAEIVEQFVGARPEASIGLTLDETCGRVVALVSTTADAQLVDEIVAELGLPKSLVVPVVADAGFASIDRYNYHNPQIGGLSLQVKNFSTGAAKQCTSAIPFHNGSGSLYAVTAAHCLPSVSPTPHLGYYANIDWYQGLIGGVDINAWGGSYYVYGGQLDVTVTKIISSASADSRTMWHGGNHSTVAMGWWKWHESLSKKNDPVCHSGVNWGHQVCGIITDVDWNGTVSGVSFDGLMKTNMTGYAGDSGGTVWSDLPDGRWYVGIMAAANGPETLFTHVGHITGKFWWLQAPVNMS